MAAKDDVLTKYPNAHAEFIPPDPEFGTPATWAIFFQEGTEDQPHVAPTEDEVWEKGAEVIAAAEAAAANAPAIAAAAAAENESIRDYMANVYQSLWDDWYVEIDEAEPAELDIRFQDGTDGYESVDHKHYFFVSEGNRTEILQDRDNNFDLMSEPVTWKNWYIVMVHEMIHEYQYRVLNDEITPEGQHLHDTAHKDFPGPGHGPGFYSAIADRAQYFGVENVPAFIQIL